jgi:hypothetical protein
MIGNWYFTFQKSLRTAQLYRSSCDFTLRLVLLSSRTMSLSGLKDTDHLVKLVGTSQTKQHNVLFYFSAPPN